MRACGGKPKSAKDIALWIAEKASRFKLDYSTSLGVFEAVEFLCLGVLGKLVLWDALDAAAERSMIDLEALKRRAREQHSSLESLRLKLARSLFWRWDNEAECGQREEAVRQWACEHGIQLAEKHFSAGKAGEFDGTSISINKNYNAQERLYYALHAIGSIAIWSRDPQVVQALISTSCGMRRKQEGPSLRSLRQRSNATVDLKLNRPNMRFGFLIRSGHRRSYLAIRTSCGPIWKQ